MWRRGGGLSALIKWGRTTVFIISTQLESLLQSIDQLERQADKPDF
jgi:hypothetical protein